MSIISAQIEEEISQLEAEEAEMFLEEMGLEEAGLDRSDPRRICAVAS